MRIVTNCCIDCELNIKRDFHFFRRFACDLGFASCLHQTMLLLFFASSSDIPWESIFTSSASKFSGISFTLNFSISFNIWFLVNRSREFLYSSLICFDINVFRSFKSFAPRFFANWSSILTSSGFFTDVIEHLNFAFLLTNSFSGKFSGSTASTIVSSPFFTPISCLSNPFKNKSLPRVNCVFFPSPPLKDFSSTVAL